MEELELPAGWEEAPIGAFCMDIEQGVPGENETFFYIDIGSVDRNTKTIAVLTEILGVDAPSRARKRVRVGDVLVSMTRPNLNAVALVPPELDGHIATTGFDVLRCPALDCRWLFYLVRTKAFVEDMDNLVQGALYPAVKSKDIRSFVIPVAPINEQRRIASKLDTTLAAVNACRQRLDGVAAILKRFRQAVLAAATSGELTREWREDRGIEVAPTISLGEIIKVSSGKFLPAKAMVACGGIPVYGGNGVNGLHNESNISEPTLVIGRVGYYCGSIHLTPEKAWITDNALSVRHDAASTRTKYLYYALQGIDLRENDSSTAQPVISGSKIYPLRLICPCIEEQDEIVDRVESLFTLANQLEARLTAARKVVDRLTPALLAKAFRGELVPQDPNDEPASLLLERIRAARQADAAAGKSSGRGRKKAAALPDQLPLDAAPVPPDLLSGLLRECGALSERALLAASELDAGRFRRQLEHELKAGSIRDTNEEGKSLLEAVEAP